MFTTVEVAVRAELRLAPLRHVTDMIDAFLLPSTWTLEGASERGFVRLLDLLLRAGVGVHFGRLRFGGAVSRLISSDGSLSLLEWWMTRYLPDQETRVVGYALQRGNINTLAWLELKGICLADHIRKPILVSISSSAMAYWLHDHVKTVRMAIDVSCDSTEIPPGFMDFVRWAVLHRNQYQVTGIESAMNAAASCGLLQYLQWLHSETSEQCSPPAFSNALSNGHLTTAQWLYETYPKRYFQDPSGLLCDLELVEWIVREYNWRRPANRVARFHWMLLHACDIGRSAEASILHVMRFLQSVQLESNALRLQWPLNGSITVDQRCRHSNDWYDPGSVMQAAASNGLLQLVQWLHFNEAGGCTTELMDQAATNGHLDVVQWLHCNRTEGCTTKAMSGAIENNHLEVVQWLHENRTEGYDPTSMDAAAAHGHLEMVQWLHLNRTEGCTANAMTSAAIHGHLDMVKWLHENRSEGSTVYAMISSAQRVHLEVLKYLHGHQQCRCTKKRKLRTRWDT